MEIEDCGELKKFETMPTEATLYLSIVLYGGGTWCAGPSGYSKEEVIKMLQYFSGVTNARLYSVKVPISSMPA